MIALKYPLLFAALALAAPVALADGAHMQGSTVRCYPESDEPAGVPEIHLGAAGAFGLVVVGGLMLLTSRRGTAGRRLADNG